MARSIDGPVENRDGFIRDAEGNDYIISPDGEYTHDGIHYRRCVDSGDGGTGGGEIGGCIFILLIVGYFSYFYIDRGIKNVYHQLISPKIDSITTPSAGSYLGERLVITIANVEFCFRWCPAGTFIMGSPASEEERDNNETQHQVTLTKGFWIMETEITQEQWKTIMGYNPSNFNNNDKLPVENVPWYDCKKFCDKTGLQLPTEAQWEYACRAGTTGPYAGDLNEMAWYGKTPSYFRSEESSLSMYYNGNSDNKTHLVGTKKPNAWGLYDMHGNVSEWCVDGHDKSYSASGAYYPYPSANQDPVGKGSFVRMYRGGNYSTYCSNCRAASRKGTWPNTQVEYIGFRCVIVP